MAEVQTEVPNVQEQVVESGSFKEIIKNLMATGACKRFSGLRIKNVNVSEITILAFRLLSLTRFLAISPKMVVLHLSLEVLLLFSLLPLLSQVC